MNRLQDSEFLKREIYVVPHEGKTIAYAPLTRLFGIYEWSVSKTEIPGDWLDQAFNPRNVPEFILEKGFSDERRKLKVRMNVTSKCNLNCSYCSVNAKMGTWKHMDRELAYSTISRLADLAEKWEMASIELTFSGWEPTLRSRLIEDVVNFADERLKSRNIILVTKLLTNGVISESVAKELVPLFNGIQVSWDWFLKDHPRYGEENEKISRKVHESIRIFSEGGSTVNIAIVVSEKNSHMLEEIVDEIYDSFQIGHIFFALRDSLGKAAGKGGLDYGALRREYMKTWKKYRDKGIDLPLTGTDIHSISQYPCGVSAPNFSIAPDGTISSCTVSFNDTDEFAKSYDIGKILKKGITLDSERISAFQKINVTNLSACSNCLAKWHCRWGCAYANRNVPLPHAAPERCNFIRQVVADKILWLSWVK